MITIRSKAILAAVFVCGVAASARAGDVPDSQVTPAVKNALKALYPDGTVVSLEKERAGGVRRFMAVVKDKKEREHKLTLRPDGSIVDSRDPIDAGELPAAVTAEVGKRFPKGKVASAAKLTNNKKVSYEVIVDDGGLKPLLLNEDGSDAPAPGSK